MFGVRFLAVLGTLLLVSCAASAPATGQQFLETPFGVRIFTVPGRCVPPETEELSGNVQYEQLTIVQGERVRRNPHFLFNKEPFGPNRAARASLAIGSLQQDIIRACSNWYRAAEADKAAYWSQRDELLIDVVHLATRIEAAKSVAEYEALLDEARIAANRRLEEEIRRGR